ncbi:MAG: peptidoglycan-binding protein LysM [Pseudomonadota bacterium]
MKGLFKFAKDAGERVTGAMSERIGSVFGKKDAPAATGSAADAYGVDASRIEVAQDGAKVTVKGAAKTQAEAEKIIVAAGNTAGVEEVESDIEVEETAPQATFYTVVSGDTLSKIAKAHYGDAMKYPTIFDANRPMLSDPDKIYPGQTLRIPPLD